MDPTKLLEADHRQVEKLFDQIQKAEGQARTSLVHELATAVRGHMQLEEQVLYPAMRPVTGEKTVEEGVNEHEMARTALEDMVKLTPDGPGFEAALEVMKAGIEHHVEDEEGKVFPELRKDGQPVLEQVATPMMQMRVELGLPIDPSALAASSTKDELLAEAKNAGIDGTSSMTKEQLAEALVAQMAA